jgi:hypothetical protein
MRGRISYTTKRLSGAKLHSGRVIVCGSLVQAVTVTRVHRASLLVNLASLYIAHIHCVPNIPRSHRRALLQYDKPHSKPRLH